MITLMLVGFAEYESLWPQMVSIIAASIGCLLSFAWPAVGKICCCIMASVGFHATYLYRLIMVVFRLDPMVMTKVACGVKVAISLLTILVAYKFDNDALWIYSALGGALLASRFLRAFAGLLRNEYWLAQLITVSVFFAAGSMVQRRTCPYANQRKIKKAQA